MKLGILNGLAPDGTKASAVVATGDREGRFMFRFALTRTWAGEEAGRYVAWLMLNPSTADHQANDPTITKITAMSRSWGYDGLAVVNLYPMRTPAPGQLWRWVRSQHTEAGRPEWYRRNAEIVAEIGAGAALRVVAFGNDPILTPGRASHARGMCVLFGDDPHCIGTTKGGAPTHPMARGAGYISKGVQPQPWRFSWADVTTTERQPA